MGWLKKHPKATRKDIFGAGFASELSAIYRGRVNDAKEPAKIDKKFINKKQVTEERRLKILEYLKDSPEAGYEEILKAGFASELSTFYKNSPNIAKRAAGVDKKYIKEHKKHEPVTEERRMELLKYLKDNPEASTKDICDAGFGGVLKGFYKRSLNAAKRDAGVDKKYIEEHEPVTEERRKELLYWLKDNPEAGWKETYNAGFASVLDKFYNGSINEAKEEAGVDEKYMRYVGRKKRDNQLELARKLL